MMNNKQRVFNLASLLWPLTVTPVYAALESNLDSVNCDVVKGWAWDNALPATRLKLDIYDVTATKTTRLTTLTAQRFRQDLLDAGKGDGRYGFVFNLPATISTDGNSHQLSVRFQGTSTELTNSPKSTSGGCYGKFNDTGIQSCNNSLSDGLVCPVAGFEGQDGDYGRDAAALAGTLAKTGAGNAGFDFTKIANNGSTLPASAQLGTGPQDWACTLDNATKLLWEVKTDDSGLRDKDNTYGWYNPDNTSNGGHKGFKGGGTCMGSISCDTQGYTRAVNAQKLCGKNDWRVPTQSELYSIVDYGRLAPTIDSDYFPNTEARPFWSFTPAAGEIYFVWFVNFYGGFDFTFGKYDIAVVRLVR